MKKYRYIWLMVCFLFIGISVNAQGYIGGKPHSYDKELRIIKTNKTKDALVTLQCNDCEMLSKNYSYIDSINHYPLYFGKPISVNLNTTNSGEWLNLENGNKMWRLIIYCPKAKSISLHFNQFWLPQGSTFYVFSADKSTFLGGYTSGINNGTKFKPKEFYSGIIKSEKIIIEYFEPKEVMNQGIISISKVFFGNLNFEDYLTENAPGVDAPGATWGGQSNCYVDVNCPEGNLWKVEKSSVVKLVQSFKFENGILIDKGSAFCSASLINNSNRDGKLYLLTAGHCLNDTTRGAYLDWLVYWNYENTNCGDNSKINEAYVTRGVRVIATDYPNRDFALVELVQSPYDVGFKPSYNGWSRNEPTSTETLIGIHHPAGFSKKISTGIRNSIYANQVHWSITQPSGIRSRIYRNSSGSPLYDSTHRVISELVTGGPLDDPPPYVCTDPAWGGYVSIVSAWDGSRKQDRLRDWLCFTCSESNIMTLDSMTCQPKIISQNYSGITKTETWCQIQAKNVTISNGSHIIFNAANGVILQSDFEVKLGNEFEIQLNKTY